MNMTGAISLLSEQGLNLLSSNESVVDERLLISFRKQMNNTTCGIASICVVMTALSLGCDDYIPDFTEEAFMRGNRTHQNTFPFLLERANNDTKSQTNCTTNLRKLKSALTEFLTTSNMTNHTSFLDAFNRNENRKDDDKDNITNGLITTTYHLPSRNNEIKERLTNQNIGFSQGSPVWLDEIDILNSEHAQESLNTTDISRYGMALGEVSLLLRAYNLKVQLIFASNTTLNDFRQNAINLLSNHTSGGCIIVNYNGKYLDPRLRFSGHHSPLGGYNHQLDRFLILDVFPKNPEIWVNATKLFNAMNTVDKASGKSRGYLVVSTKT